jgi:Na+/proline symporter
VPLAAGIYWRRATRQGALLSSLAGLATWLTLELLNPEAFLPPQFAGLLASIAGMVAGSLLPQWYGGRHRGPHAA